jgi:Gram-negative bacterial TonB protein C-terminal
MKKLLFSLFNVLLFYVFGFGQTNTADTIYQAPEKPAYPLLGMCMPENHAAGWNEDSIRACGDLNLMRLTSRNMIYPEAARQANVQGTVVTQMVIEKNGRISNIKILKDIGNGCGAEAVRILTVLDSLGLKWSPGLEKSQPVRSYKNLPFRFRLTEEIPYTIGERGDTIYNLLDQQPEFKGGVDSLLKFIVNRLEYPTKYLDSCKVGVIETSLLVAVNGKVTVENQLDFNNLGADFQFKSIKLVNRMNNMWEPATYKGKQVPTTIPVRTLFQSDKPGCKLANDNFDKAMLLANEGVIMSDTGNTEGAIKKMSEALALQPDNTELLYYRGTLLLNTKENEAACIDYNRIKTILGRTWFEPVRRLVCGW